MSHYLLKLALVISFVLMMTCLIGRAVGSIRPLNPALRGFTEGCEGMAQPCWYGIIPGVTTLAKAHLLLDQHGYRQECVHAYNTAGIINQLELWPCAGLPPLYIGDVINQLGAIKGVTIIPNNSDIVYINDTLVFKNTFVTADLSYTAWRKQRYYTVVPITLSAAPVKKIDFKWYGAISTTRLCKKEPRYLVCGFCNLMSSIEVYDSNGVCR